MQLQRFMNTIQPTEHQIQTLIINYLKIKGWYVMRMNSGKYSLGEGRSKRFVQGHEAGTPDVMAFKKFTKPGTEKDYGSYATAEQELSLLFIEVKRPKKKATVLQEAKMKELQEYGAKCIIATSIEDLKAKGI